MKLLKVLILIGFVYSASAQSRIPDIIQRIVERLLERGRSALNQRIIDLIESQRENIGTGWPELGIPPFDPFLIEDVQFEIDAIETLSAINFRLRDAYVQGIQQFEIKSLDVRILGGSLNFEVDFKRLTIDGIHSTQANLGILGVSGNGNISMIFNDFRVQGTVQLNLRDFCSRICQCFLRVHDISIKLQVGTVNANLRGFGVFLDPTISLIFSAAMPGFINNSDERINEMISESVVPALNDILGHQPVFEMFIDVIRSLVGRNNADWTNEAILEKIFFQ